MIFGRSKKEATTKKQNLRASGMEIDWRISPSEFFRLMFIGSLLLYAVGWYGVITASLLYLFAIGNLVMLFLYDSEPKLTFFQKLPSFAGMLFLLLAFFPDSGAYIFGAYLSSGLCVLLQYPLLARGVSPND